MPGCPSPPCPAKRGTHLCPTMGQMQSWHSDLSHYPLVQSAGTALGPQGGGMMPPSHQAPTLLLPGA